MKALLKILTALAAVAGMIYILATFGDKIVEWAKKLLPNCVPDVEIEVVVEPSDVTVEETTEEKIVEEETPVEEVAAEETAPVAEETDFEA